MHQNMVAHRVRTTHPQIMAPTPTAHSQDIYTTNILSNHITFLPDGRPKSAPFRSTFNYQIGFIDFEVSSTFLPGEDVQICHTPGLSRSDAPETRSNMPYDPFLSDIFSMGQHLLAGVENAHLVC